MSVRKSAARGRRLFVLQSLLFVETARCSGRRARGLPARGGLVPVQLAPGWVGCRVGSCQDRNSARGGEGGRDLARPGSRVVRAVSAKTVKPLYGRCAGPRWTQRLILGVLGMSRGCPDMWYSRLRAVVTLENHHTPPYRCPHHRTPPGLGSPRMLSPDPVTTPGCPVLGGCVWGGARPHCPRTPCGLHPPVCA